MKYIDIHTTVWTGIDRVQHKSIDIYRLYNITRYYLIQSILGPQPDAIFLNKKKGNDLEQSDCEPESQLFLY